MRPASSAVFFCCEPKERRARKEGKSQGGRERTREAPRVSVLYARQPPSLQWRRLFISRSQQAVKAHSSLSAAYARAFVVVPTSRKSERVSLGSTSIIVLTSSRRYRAPFVSKDTSRKRSKIDRCLLHGLPFPLIRGLRCPAARDSAGARVSPRAPDSSRSRIDTSRYGGVDDACSC